MFMPPILLTNSVAAASNPWYGFRLRPKRTRNTTLPQQGLAFLRNIFYVKCHALFLAPASKAGCALLLFVLAVPAVAQQTKIRTPRPGAPESNFVNINADHQTQEG